ncbi:hypothetical protein H310_11633 [Aphanomyces invadans]|uniref:GH18 domain-containing protein n=1 Tax=Aphanomyces invadans TaxID=157072 RepID=A0A024TKV4_9STRA|nr:hypothetical protein H310_11633 [Aphanomyces invadans]ETV94639.1 hypothetical protein H310_11633 [Aphanomyces invadans]|eukprot:XP_008876584.1 hypothetical protein H310_11633 [Aphanomyces invadans]
MKFKKRHAEIAVGLVLLAGAFVGVLFGAGVFQDSAEVATRKAFDSAANALAPRDIACPVIPPGKRLIQNIPSQRQGCSSVTEGVTHVVLTYADLAAKSFQLNDVDVLSCVSDLRKRCIYVLGGIGGDKMFNTSTVAADAAAVVSKFKLDGITVHDLSKSSSTLSYMTALSASLKALNATLSYDVYYSELDKTKLNCGTRCFAEGVQHVVDWLTVMAFSVSDDAVYAADIYADAIAGFLDPWKAKLQNATGKLNIGVCTDCGFGPGPTSDDISIWTTYSQTAGGMSVYGSGDGMFRAIQSIFQPKPLPIAMTRRPLSGNNSMCQSDNSSHAPRVVLYWGSEVGGCETIPPGVTHVVMTFALVKDGAVSLTLQGDDATLRRCVVSLQQRCIDVLVSIGGDTDNHQLAGVTDMDTFAASAVALVDKFNFDGVDVDDENRAGTYDQDHVVEYMAALSKALKPRGKLLTMAAFYYDSVADKCAAVSGRCFPRQVEALVDWVNVMAYNVEKDVGKAEAVYESAITDTFAMWMAVLPPAKVVVAVCTESTNPLHRGCSYGPGPSPAVVAQWTKWSRENAGGMGVWAGSKDQFLNYTYTTLVTGGDARR